MRAPRFIASAVIVGVLVVLPAAAATAAPAAPVAAAAAAAAPPPSLPGGLGRAYDLESYRLSMMPPSVADVRQYNPSWSDSQVADYVVNAEDAWWMQRQQAVLSRNNLPASAYATSTNAMSADVKAAIDAQKAGWRLPTFPGATLVKVIGGATVAFSGYELGIGIGNGVLRMSGLNPEGQACGGDGGDLAWAGVLVGADCGNWLKVQQAAVNADVGAQAALDGNLCDSSGVCHALTGMGFTTDAGGHSTPAWLFTNTVTDRLTIVFRSPTGTFQSSDAAPVTPQLGGPGIPTGTTGYEDALPNSSPICMTFTTGCGADGTASGAAQAVHQAPQDPSRVITCTVRGSDGADYSASSDAFHESAGAMAAPTCPSLPAGVTPENVKLTEKGAPGTSGVPSQGLYDQNADPYSKHVAQQFPECMTGLCTLDLIDTTTGKSCFSEATSCDGWFSDPQKATKYECTYDHQTVDLGHCNAYRQVFNEAMRNNGSAYSNPADGSTSLTISSTSSAGTKAGQLAAQPSISDCVAETVATGDVWGIIFSPVRCALVWAFLPDALTQQVTLNDTVDAFMATPIGKVDGIVLGWFATLTVGGCQGPAIDWAGNGIFKGGIHAHPINACAGAPLADFAPPSRVFLDCLLFVFGAIACINNIASVVGFRGIALTGGGDE